jgi:hypothetical protein
MAGALGVLGEQHVAGVQGEFLAVTRREHQRARKSHDELAYRCGVPRQRAAACRLLDGDVRRRHRRRHLIVVATGAHVQPTDLDVRRTLLPGPQSNASDHFRLPSPTGL